MKNEDQEHSEAVCPIEPTPKSRRGKNRRHWPGQRGRDAGASRPSDQTKTIDSRDATCFHIHKAPLELTSVKSLGRFVQNLADAKGGRYAVVLMLRSGQDVGHRDVDYALVKLPPRLAIGGVHTYFERLVQLANLAVEMGLADDK